MQGRLQRDRVQRGICFRVLPAVRSPPTPAASQADSAPAEPPFWWGCLCRAPWLASGFIHPSEFKAFCNPISAAPHSFSSSHINVPAVISTVCKPKAICCNNTLQQGGYYRN